MSSPAALSGFDACRYREQVAAAAEGARGNFQQACPDRSRCAPLTEASEAPDPFESLRRELPTFIRACHENPDPAKPVFWLYTWSPDNPSVVTRAPYSCRSWRCPFGCAVHESHVLYARMQEAFGDVPPSELVFLVLTLDGEYHDLTQHDLPTLYKTLGKRLEKFRKRLRRLLTSIGVAPFAIDWVAVIEEHRSGVPHVNILMHCPSWARWLAGRYASKRAWGMTPRNARLLAGTEKHRDETDERFLGLLSACGFGYRSSAEVARNSEAAIGYIGKVAGHADHTADRIARRLARDAKKSTRAVGETTKLSQLPIRAPKGFRRLRSGVGFLPARKKGDKTGMLIKRYRTSQGDEIARPLVVTERPDLLAMQELICNTEQSLCWKDEELALRVARLRRLRMPTKLPRREQITQHHLHLPNQPGENHSHRPEARAGPDPPSELNGARAGPASCDLV